MRLKEVCHRLTASAAARKYRSPFAVPPLVAVSMDGSPGGVATSNPVATLGLLDSRQPSPARCPCDGSGLRSWLLSLLVFFQRRQPAHNCRARCTASYVAQIEGQTKVPSLATLEKLAKALNVKVGRLLE